MQSDLRWREVHQLEGWVTTLEWSTSGHYLCCADNSGQTVVIDSENWAAHRLLEARPDKDKGVRGSYATWEYCKDSIAVETTEAFRILDLQGRTVATAGALFTPMLRARPIFGGYAWMELDHGNMHRIAISEASTADQHRLPDPICDVRDLAWSPDGRNLAIACGSGAVVAHPWLTETAYVTVNGPVNTLIWLDDAHLAVGCVDTNIRIYAWPQGVERSIPSSYWSSGVFAHRPGAELVDVLEDHDDFVAGLSGPNVHGQFASWDYSGTLNFWTPRTGGYALLHSTQLPSHNLVAVAMHQQKALIAVVGQGRLSVAECELPASPDTPRPAPGNPTSTLDIVLARAGITGAQVHSDSVRNAWDIGHRYVDQSAAEKANATRGCKVIAASTRQILKEVERCLGLLWSQPCAKATVDLERLAFGKALSNDPGEVRQHLLALLSAEIQADQPRSRVWATTAYVGIGHLGLTEAAKAFGSESTIGSLLVKMEPELRGAVRAAEDLLLERSIEAVAKAIQGTFGAVDAVQSRYADAGGTLMLTEVAHTLILKGGGAKGLAHVGALLELRRYYPFDRFVGTSAGAIVAVLLGAGFTDEELLAELQKTDFNEKILEPWPRRLWNLVTRMGMFTGNDLQNWLGDLLRAKLNAIGPVMMSRLPLHTTVFTCQPHRSEVRFDSTDGESENTPASYAARCSMSIPFFFTPAAVGGIHAFDGGLRINYPVDPVLRDDPRKPFIGLYLGAPNSMKDAGTCVLAALYQSVFEAKDRELAQKYHTQTVIMNTAPIGLLDFKMSEAEKRFLVLTGRVSALLFLEKEQEVELNDRHVVAFLIAEREKLRKEVADARAVRARRRKRIGLAVLLVVGGLAALRWVPFAPA